MLATPMLTNRHTAPVNAANPFLVLFIAWFPFPRFMISDLCGGLRSPRPLFATRFLTALFLQFGERRKR